VTFSVISENSNLSISEVKKQDYSLKNPAYYDCKISADYIICGGFDADQIPSSYYVNNRSEMWIHFIKRVDGAQKGDGKSIFYEYKSNDDIFPGLYPKNQYVVQNYEQNIISFIEPFTRNVITISVDMFVQRVNAETYHQFWKFFFVSAAVILMVLFACINAGRQFGKNVNWDEIKLKTGLKPASIEQNSGSDESTLPEKKEHKDSSDEGYTLTG